MIRKYYIFFLFFAIVLDFFQKMDSMEAFVISPM